MLLYFFYFFHTYSYTLLTSLPHSLVLKNRILTSNSWHFLLIHWTFLNTSPSCPSHTLRRKGRIGQASFKSWSGQSALMWLVLKSLEPTWLDAFSSFCLSLYVSLSLNIHVKGRDECWWQSHSMNTFEVGEEWGEMRKSWDQMLCFQVESLQVMHKTWTCSMFGVEC